MKLLIVANYNKGRFAPFILEQVEALKNEGISIDFYKVIGKGISGYLKNGRELIKTINKVKPDIVHAHYGLSGLLANLQRRVPVVTTYHGSDINLSNIYRLSRICMKLSAFNIFVSKKNQDKAGLKKNQILLPCGVDLELFVPMDKSEAREKLGLDLDEKLVLFAGAFDNKVKNPALAQSAVALMDNVRLLELKNYTREQVAMLMNAVDVALMTSLTEGSPQFIKEAMACNCPIVSADVGDVKEVIGETQGCYIAAYDYKDIAYKLKQALAFATRTNGRNRIIDLNLENKAIANKLISIYNEYA